MTVTLPATLSVARCTTAAAVAALLIPAAALSANPAKSTTYVGTREGGTTALTKKVSLKVGANGRTATALLYCGSSRQPMAMPHFAISGGRFKATKKTGTVTLWKISGRFTSKTTAVATLNLVTTCDGKGATITLTAKPRA